MVKYKYDTDTMIAKIREQWTPNDFFRRNRTFNAYWRSI